MVLRYRAFTLPTIPSVLGFLIAGVHSSAVHAATEGTPSRSTYETSDLETSRYQRQRPSLGIELATSFSALGQQALTTSQGKNQTYAFHLAVEYQPKFVQKYGVLSFGPSVGTYPIFGERVTPSYFSIWSYGGQVRYQARYFREQPVVPMIGYAVDQLSYQFTDGSNGQMLLQGPIYGLWVLLNFLDRSAANQFHIEQGVLRSYLVLEGRNLTGSNDAGTLAVNRASFYMGLRCEL